MANSAPIISVDSRTGSVHGFDRGDTKGIAEATILPDGSVFGVGGVFLYKLTADGKLAPTLDVDGTDFAAPPTGAFFEFGSVVRLADGRYLVAGADQPLPVQYPALETRLFVARLNADGSYDESFAQGSSEATTTLKGQVRVQDITVLDDGKILTLADLRELDGNGEATNRHQVALQRLLPDGTPDASFGSNGVILSAAHNAKPMAMSIQSDGKIVVAGAQPDASGIDKFVVYRFRADGSLDTGFGTGGAVKPVFPSPYYNGGDSYASAVAIQADGKIIVVGKTPLLLKDFSSWSETAVMRFNANGSLDTSFGTGGMQFVRVRPDGGTWTPSGTDFVSNDVSSVIVTEDGGIFIGGTSAKNTIALGGYAPQFAVTKLKANGSLDTSFGNKGIATTNFGAGARAIAKDMLIDHAGRITVVGDLILADGTFTAGVARLNPDGSPDMTFGSASSAPGSTAVIAQSYPDQFIAPSMTVSDADLALTGRYEGASVTLARHGGANTADLFGTGGALRFLDGTAYVDGVAVGSVTNADGKLKIDFNTNATAALINKTLQSITYQHATLSQTGTVAVDWTFSDGNKGAQGDGGPLEAGITTQLTLRAADGQYWIDAMLPQAAGQSNAQLRDSYRSYFGATPSVYVQYPQGDNGTVLPEEQKALVALALSELSKVSGIKLAATGGSSNVLTIRPSANLEDGSGAATPPGSKGSNVYLSAEANYETVLRELAFALGLKLANGPSGTGAVLPQADLSAGATVLGDHTIGLGHLGDLDIAALQYLYGVGAGSRSGDDTYLLDSTHSNFIWDGAGNDTISAAGQELDLFLHLTAGNWDYLGTRQSAITAAGQLTINHGTSIENAIGGKGNDQIIGSAANNSLSGGSGNDRLQGLGGNDVLNGGEGLDTAIYEGNRAATTLVRSANGFTVKGPEGTDQLTGVERVQFSDMSVALDIDGNAGQIYRLYQAVFNRAPDLAGMGFWLYRKENGQSLESIANAFITSAEFTRLYGDAADAKTILTKLYQYALHREPDAAGFNHWMGKLESGATSYEQLVISFSESAENQAQVIGSIQNGINYTPFG
ncbi:DUF4214 domain-containing protein [Massilia endophytica]|uniref:DUF4214 domain-containing protein n=1 Tax=Massilia endophytica TaxID=2899220 RepID=UPI001E539DA1|nr:DUF4214 domain-containing protein [Massilia endophytica]UGQ48028.1 DUF4214 domain-containing protein [Massilia endophytica]